MESSGTEVKPVKVKIASCIARSTDPRKLILSTLERTGGCIYRAAHELGVNRETLRRWIRKLGLYPEVKRIREERKVSLYKSRFLPRFV